MEYWNEALGRYEELPTAAKFGPESWTDPLKIKTSSFGSKEHADWIKQQAETNPEVWGGLGSLYDSLYKWSSDNNISFKTKGQSNEGNLANLALNLYKSGITDLGQLQYTSDGKLVNRETGQPVTLGGNRLGDGKSEFRAQPLPNGGFAIVPAWKNTSDVGKIAPIAGGLLALTGIGAPLGAALGASGAAASALGGALLSGGLNYAAGGNFLQGALSGGLGGYFAPGLGTAAAAPGAAGSGAFLGEGVASGIPAWDAAATAAGLDLGAAGAAAAGGIGSLQNIPALAGDFGATDIGSKVFDKAVSAGLGGETALNIANAAAGVDKFLGLGNYSYGASDVANTAFKTKGIWDTVKDVIGGGGGVSDWMKLLIPALTGYAAYKDAKRPQLQGYSGSIKPYQATQTIEQSRYGPIARTGFAAGGIAGLPRFLDSPHDGMTDGIAATIDGEKPAALSGGEFVIPADVVSHLGNGNSQAGAQQLFQMMERIRQARTGTSEQGRQINPSKFMPA